MFVSFSSDFTILFTACFYVKPSDKTIVTLPSNKEKWILKFPDLQTATQFSSIVNEYRRTQSALTQLPSVPPPPDNPHNIPSAPFNRQSFRSPPPNPPRVPSTPLTGPASLFGTLINSHPPNPPPVTTNASNVINAITSLDGTSVKFTPSNDGIKREGNTIIHHGPDPNRNCFIGGVMTSV